MCCKSSSQTNQGGQCGCQSESCFSAELWSKKKQIQYVKNSITCLQSQVKDLGDKLNELEKDK
jgi:hypothetical protein